MTRSENFNSGEFRDWVDDMSPRLVTMMDVLRFMCGHPIEVSANDHALGRNLGLDDLSAHNVDKWGEVLAMDCFVAGVHYREQAEWIVDLARKIGFTGIGVYTDTRNNRGANQVMFHFDVRPTRKMGEPATWGRVSRKYVSIDQALQSLPLGGKS